MFSYADAAHSHFVTYNLIFPDNPQEELILFLAYVPFTKSAPPPTHIFLGGRSIKCACS